MTKFLVLGAGRMAKAIVHDLKRKNLEIVIWDNNYNAIKSIFDHEYPYMIGETLDLSTTEYEKPDNLSCIINTLPSDLAERWTRKAIEWGVHYVDLGGNNDVVAKQFELSKDAKEREVSIVPDCGLAPGLVSILAIDLLAKQECHSLPSIYMFVGGLPLQITNDLEYQIVFSPHGLINEYIEPATILKDGQIIQVPSLDDIDPFEMPWHFNDLEVFYTSGGASTLPFSLKGKCKNVEYKTIRYAGHAQKMKQILSLFSHRREELETLLASAFPLTGPDVILLDVRICTGNGHYPLRKHQIIEFGSPDTLTAMAKMTAYPASIIAQACCTGMIDKRGTLKQEELFKTGDYMINELKERGITFLTE